MLATRGLGRNTNFFTAVLVAAGLGLSSTVSLPTAPTIDISSGIQIVLPGQSQKYTYFSDFLISDIYYESTTALHSSISEYTLLTDIDSSIDFTSTTYLNRVISSAFDISLNKSISLTSFNAVFYDLYSQDDENYLLDLEDDDKIILKTDIDFKVKTNVNFAINIYDMENIKTEDDLILFGVI